ncbi:MAG: FtsQ-type POTRA domain-containing protein [Actinomycetota bacterium]
MTATRSRPDRSSKPKGAAASTKSGAKRKPPAKKKAAPKKASAKKKPAAKRAAPRKPAAKKVAAKKAVSRKPAAKKAVSRKPAAKKAVSRKPAAKKAVSRKMAANGKKAAPRKKAARKKPTAKKTAVLQPAAKAAPRRLDPRLQARRRSVARSQGRRRLGIVAALTAVATLALIAIGLDNSRLFDVDEVVVTGADRADARHIVAASGVDPGQPLSSVDPAATAMAVEAVPWVASATVTRTWRGVIQIEVVERQEAAVIETDGRFVLVDLSGRQLEVVADRPAGFLTIDGVQATGVPGDVIEPVAVSAVAVAVGLSPDMIPQTERVEVADEQVFLQLTIGGRANLGDDRDLDAKMVALETVLSRVDLTCLDLIDVRVADAPTVRRLPIVSGTEETLAGTVRC